MRTARAHAAMWSAGARTHARELWRDKRRKARCEQFADVAAPVSIFREGLLTKRETFGSDGSI